jgi:two-component system, NarL family, response regulator LiaR
MAIRVLLADDHTLFRQGVKQILRSYQGIEVVGEAENGEEACQLVDELSPDVVVMDMHMPRMDGVRATRAIMQCNKPPAIIILTMSKQDDYVFEAIKAGARGYYLKDADYRALIEAIETAAAGETVLEPSLAQRVLREFRNPTGAHQRVTGLSALDDREIDILRRVAGGQTNQSIGEALQLSEKTIKNQLSQIFHKLQLENRTQAAIYALRHGLVTLEELSV